MQEPIIYNCKENNSRLKVVIEDGKIVEIWIEDHTHKEQWLVVGFQDLKNAIKEAEDEIQNNQNFIIKINTFGDITLVARNQNDTFLKITEQCEEYVKTTKDWRITQAGNIFVVSTETYGILKSKKLLSEYFFRKKEFEFFVNELTRIK